MKGPPPLYFLSAACTWLLRIPCRDSFLRLTQVLQAGTDKTFSTVTGISDWMEYYRSTRTKTMQQYKGGISTFYPTGNGYAMHDES